MDYHVAQPSYLAFQQFNFGEVSSKATIRCCVRCPPSRFRATEDRPGSFWDFPAPRGSGGVRTRRPTSDPRFWLPLWRRVRDNAHLPLLPPDGGLHLPPTDVKDQSTSPASHFGKTGQTRFPKIKHVPQRRELYQIATPRIKRGSFISVYGLKLF